MNQVANLNSAGGLSTESQAMHGLVLFMTSELLQDMVFNWPNGAKRIEDNLEGAARSYARQLTGHGFTPKLIREALQAEIDTGRDFMPTPSELANRCKALMGHTAKPAAVAVVSMSSIRMNAESQLYQAGQSITELAIQRTAQVLAAELGAKGVQVAGGDW